MSKLTIYFYIGLLAASILSLLATLTVNMPHGVPFRIALFVIIGQAHFLIAYIYYIDVLRVKLPNIKKFLLFFVPFLLLVLAYYFTRYVWLMAFAPFISLLTTVYFLVHHFENVFYFGENFYQNLLPKKRTNLGHWLVAFMTSTVVVLLTYSYYVTGEGDTATVFAFWIFFVSFIVHCFITYQVYKKVNTKSALFLLSIPIIFLGLFLLQSVTYTDLRFFIVFWHFFMWMLLYPLLLLFRNKSEFPKQIATLPGSFVTTFLRKTRKNVWNFIMFYVVLNAFMVLIYFVSANVQGVAPLSNEMVQNSLFWGISYFDMWAFAHITFSFFPKKV